MNSWIYSQGKRNRERYLLGESGNKTLLCIGINPSTAEPNKLDNTLNRVKNRTISLGYDSWIMINIYPQRATDPNDLHKQMNRRIHKENLKNIRELFKNNSYDIWAAWGTLINKRSYLHHCLKDIVKLIGQDNRWITIGKKSKNGHPHHPLYLKNNLPVDDFDIYSYLKYIEKEKK